MPGKDGNDPGIPPGIVFAGLVGMGQMSYLVFPERSQFPVTGPNLILPDNPADQLPARVMDEHPVTAELPADWWTGRIDRAGKPVSLRVFHEEPALFFRIFSCLRIQECPGDLICVLGLHMDENQIIGDTVPAIVVPLRQLTLYPDKFPETPAAFPAPVAYKLSHE
jgi:hypothetical protein